MSGSSENTNLRSRGFEFPIYKNNAILHPNQNCNSAFKFPVRRTEKYQSFHPGLQLHHCREPCPASPTFSRALFNSAFFEGVLPQDPVYPIPAWLQCNPCPAFKYLQSPKCHLALSCHRKQTLFAFSSER